MLNRRNFLTGFSAVALTTGVSKAHAAAQVEEYEGPDDAAAFNARVAEMSKGKLLLVVYHATWCPYCKKMFAQLEAVKNTAPVDFAVLKLDVEKFKTITTQTEGKGGVPNTRYHRDGRVIPFLYKDPSGQTHEGKNGKMYGAPDDSAELLDILEQMNRQSRIAPSPAPRATPSS